MYNNYINSCSVCTKLEKCVVNNNSNIIANTQMKQTSILCKHKRINKCTYHIQNKKYTFIMISEKNCFPYVS